MSDTVIPTQHLHESELSDVDQSVSMLDRVIMQNVQIHHDSHKEMSSRSSSVYVNVRHAQGDSEREREREHLAQGW